VCFCMVQGILAFEDEGIIAGNADSLMFQLQVCANPPLTLSHSHSGTVPSY
jgi:hypothetical protein